MKFATKKEHPKLLFSRTNCVTISTNNINSRLQSEFSQSSYRAVSPSQLYGKGTQGSASCAIKGRARRHIFYGVANKIRGTGNLRFSRRERVQSLHFFRHVISVFTPWFYCIVVVKVAFLKMSSRMLMLCICTWRQLLWNREY